MLGRTSIVEGIFNSSERNRLKRENTILKQSMEEVELLLETLIHFTPEDDSIILPLMKGDKTIKDAFEKIGHVSKNKE